MKLGLFIPTHKKNPNEVSASIWIRALGMKKYYEDLGIEVSINNPCKRYDVSILFRMISPCSKIVLRYLSVISKEVYFDTCVNYFDTSSMVSVEQVRIAKEMIDLVDGVIAASEYIQARAQKAGARAYHLPDPIDLEMFRYHKKEIHWDNPTFIWSGVSVKAGILKKYSKEMSGQLLMLTDKKIDLGFPYIFNKWSHSSFSRDIVQGDIAFLPREYDNAYDSGHSSFKPLVFAAQGIPIIANKIPSYVRMSEYYDGIVFLEDHKTFEDAVLELMKRSLDTKKVRKEYSCETQAKRLQSVLYEQHTSTKNSH